MLDAITESLEAHPCIPHKVLCDLVLVLPPVIAILQCLRQVPVVQGHKRCDTRIEQRVDEVAVEGDAGFVHRVVAAAKRNDTRP